MGNNEILSLLGGKKEEDEKMPRINLGKMFYLSVWESLPPLLKNDSSRCCQTCQAETEQK